MSNSLERNSTSCIRQYQTKQNSSIIKIILVKVVTEALNTNNPLICSTNLKFNLYNSSRNHFDLKYKILFD